MKTRIVTGTKAEIAEVVLHIEGEIREAILIVEETEPESCEPPDSCERADDLFAEMDSFTAKAGGADYSREAIYTRSEGE